MKTISEMIPAGTKEYTRQVGGFKNRIHLRVEADGNGVLLINANRIYYFNPSATMMAYAVLEGWDEDKTLKRLKNTFNVPRKQAASDFRAFAADIKRIIDPADDPCPVCDLEIDTFTPFSRQPSAPYRMDLALTYRCNNSCVHCYNESDRLLEELDVNQWKTVLEKIWDIGIPHVVFTGGEPTLIPFLPELIRHAEKLGMITGLNTNGRRLKDAPFVERLVKSGLDHVQVTLESHDAAIHDQITLAKGAWAETIAGIRNALASPLFVMTNTTLLRSNSGSLAETLAFLEELHVPTVGLNGLIYSGRGALVNESIAEDDLPALLEIAKKHAAASGQRLIWYTPTMYCHFNPIESNLGVKGCTAAQYNMCIEPDGGVLPCQSYYSQLGNILSDAWGSIWEHPLAQSIRNRDYAPDGCHYCDLMDTCGAGCPLHLQNNPGMQPEPVTALSFLRG